MASLIDFFRAEPLYHYSMDRFGLKSPILYHPEHLVLHVGGGPNRNHPREVNVNIVPLPNVDVVGDAERLPFEDESVDVIISCAVLEHVCDFEAARREICRVLKPGGFVYIEIPFLQPYHTDDGRGVTFEDYRRLTKVGLADAFDFCTPVDVGTCVGPISSVCQIAFTCLRDLSARPLYRRAVEKMYYFFGNLLAWLDGKLSDAAIERSAVPSGIYYFGRKHDGVTEMIEELPHPNSLFPRDVAAEIRLLEELPDAFVLEVVNTSRTTWLMDSPLSWGQVHVGLQRHLAGKFDRDFRRIRLPHNVGPGESFWLPVYLDDLEPIDEATIDLVIEGLCWFGDRGNKPLRIDCRRGHRAGPPFGPAAAPSRSGQWSGAEEESSRPAQDEQPQSSTSGAPAR